MNATLSEWKDFLESNVYKDLIAEIDERKNFIIPKLVAGNDSVWSDDCMRGRLDELEFVRSIPADMVAVLEMESKGGGFVTNTLNKILRKGE